MKSGQAKFTNELDALLVVNTLNQREIAGNHFTVWIDKEASNKPAESDKSEDGDKEPPAAAKSIKRIRPDEDNGQQEDEPKSGDEDKKKAKVTMC